GRCCASRRWRVWANKRCEAELCFRPRLGQPPSRSELTAGQCRVDNDTKPCRLQRARPACKLSRASCRSAGGSERCWPETSLCRRIRAVPDRVAGERSHRKFDVLLREI